MLTDLTEKVGVWGSLLSVCLSVSVCVFERECVCVCVCVHALVFLHEVTDGLAKKRLKNCFLRVCLLVWVWGYGCICLRVCVFPSAIFDLSATFLMEKRSHSRRQCDMSGSWQRFIFSITLLMNATRNTIALHSTDIFTTLSFSLPAREFHF